MGKAALGRVSEAHLQETFKPPVSYCGCLLQREVAKLLLAAGTCLTAWLPVLKS